MKKIITTMTFAIICTAQSAFALISPLNQSVKEIISILTDPTIKQLGQNNPVLDVKKNEQGYLVITKETQMLVEVIYTPVRRTGPLKYELVFHDAEPLTETTTQ
jgi:hypothetical protein